MQQIHEAFLAQLQHRGMTTRLLEKDVPLIYAELQTGATHTLLLYNYYTAQAPDKRDVAVIAACLAAFDGYQEDDHAPPVNVKWLLDGAGEMGHPRMQHIVKEYHAQLRADGCIWHGREPAGTIPAPALLAMGTKGHLSVEMEVRTAAVELHAMHGAIVPDAAWRLLWALNSLKNEHEEILIEGFYDTLTPADDDMTELVRTLPDTAASLAQQWGLAQCLTGLHGFQLHYTHLLTPTCSIAAINSGDPAQDSIPARASARIDFYLVPEQEPHDIFAKLQRHLRTHGFADVQARMLSASQPACTPVTDPFIQVVRRATIKAYGKDLPVLPLTPNSYPLYPVLHKLNIPIVIAIAQPDRESAAPDEGLQIADSAAITRQITMIIEELSHATD